MVTDAPILDDIRARRQRATRIMYQFGERMYTDIKPACDAFFEDVVFQHDSHPGIYVKAEDSQIEGEGYLVRRAVLMAGLVIIGVCSEKGWKKPPVAPFGPVQAEIPQVGGEHIVTNESSQTVKEEMDAGGANWGKRTVGEFGAPSEGDSRALAWPATFASTTNLPTADFGATSRNHTSFSDSTSESYSNDANCELPVPGATL